jgi:hypothetical protein
MISRNWKPIAIVAVSPFAGLLFGYCLTAYTCALFSPGEKGEEMIEFFLSFFSLVAFVILAVCAAAEEWKEPKP